jgi:hypothetical protein
MGMEALPKLIEVNIFKKFRNAYSATVQVIFIQIKTP